MLRVDWDLSALRLPRLQRPIGVGSRHLRSHIRSGQYRDILMFVRQYGLRRGCRIRDHVLLAVGHSSGHLLRDTISGKLLVCTSYDAPRYTTPFSVLHPAGTGQAHGGKKLPIHPLTPCVV